MRQSKVISICGAFLILSSVVFAGPPIVIHVPIDYPTIQGAIDSANDGDTVVVLPGTYTGDGNRDLDFSNGLPEGQTRAITVCSTNPNDPAIVAATIIDCEGTENEPHRGFSFVSGEDANSILDGLTITNGYANDGGGVFCNDSSPTISKCMIKNNTTTGWADGGGIYCKRSNMTITNCIVSNNTTNGHGGGISCWWYSKPIIKDCNIFNNSAMHGGGGGIYSRISEPQITNCTINNNMARYGAGIFGNHDEKPTISNCIISGNASDYNAGGGIQGCNGPITNCIITGNTGVYPGGGGLNRCNGPITNCIITNNSISNGDGGGVYRCKGPISNCLISGNSASDDGGGIDITACSNTITNCTIVGNSAAGYGGGLYAWFDSHVTISNCILWNNSGNGNEVALDYDQYDRPCTLTILYSDIKGGQDNTVIDSTCSLAWGVANIDSDPCFVDAENGAYSLLPGSPCIDAGDNSVVDPNGIDLDGNPRIINGTVDMGAYEHQLPLVIYIDTDAVGANDGSSWEDAFNTYFGLQAALAVASSGDQIRVAQGVYKPDITNGIVPPSRSATFQLKNGVTIEGGYAGFGEPDANARDIKLYETILSGDLDGDDEDFNPNGTNNDENSYHVVTGTNTNETAILDGFTITSGNAAGPGPWHERNHGGGMYNYENASPTLTNCTFRRNRARGWGGGMYNRSASNLTHPTLTNCTFNGNYAKGSGGAIMFHIGNAESTTVLTNCIFSGNSANGIGGGIDNIGSDLILNNCAFVGNWVESDNGTGGALRITENSRQTITNCIFWENLPNQIGGDDDGWIRVTHSDIQDGWQEWYDEDKGNIDVDPLFVDADGPDGIIGTEDDNLRLQADSPCIDVGDNSVVTAATDLDGKPRIVNGTVDMGAYEHQLPRVIYVDTDAVGANDGSSWEDAFNTYIGLQAALAVASSGDRILVAQGVYKPDITNGIVPPSRSATFQLKNSVNIKGGFAGFGEPDPDARDIELYETILTGDLNGDDEPDFVNYGDNCYHVVTGTATDTTAGLDGFTIRGGNSDSSRPNDRGGGMFNGQHSGPTVTNCTFNGNRAGFRGGGMYNADYCGLIVTACTFSGNRAGVGGGMSNDEKSTTVVTDCTFSANHATSTGGGMHNEESSSSPLIVTGCTFSGNSASDCGGGMRNNGQDGPCNPIVTDCIFSGNWADTGGGMYNNGDEDHGTCSPILTNCTFTVNLADNKGGGMYNYGNEGVCNPKLINCTFGGNRAGSGAGICNIDSSPLLTNCTFIGNTAYAYHGGGMYNSFNSSPTLHNCTFSGNSADDYGGAVYSFDSDPTLTNCILWGDGFDEIYVDGDSAPVTTYSDVQGGWPGDGNIDTDPLFVNESEGDYHLLPASPCIDAGNNSVIEPNSTDLDGNPRIINDVVDMGAYEFLPPIEADVHIIPRVINRNNRLKRIIAIVRLPEGINKADVSDEPFVLHVAGDEIDGIEATWQRVIGRPGRVSVFAFFNKAELMNALPNTSRVELTVTGKLKSGQHIQGSDTVRIIRPRRRRARWRRR